MGILDKIIELDPWSVTGIVSRIIVGILLILPGVSYVVFAISLLAGLFWGVSELTYRVLGGEGVAEESEVIYHLKRIAMWSVDLIAWTLLGDRDTPIHPWIND